MFNHTSFLFKIIALLFKQICSMFWASVSKCNICQRRIKVNNRSCFPDTEYKAPFFVLAESPLPLNNNQCDTGMLSFCAKTETRYIFLHLLLMRQVQWWSYYVTKAFDKGILITFFWPEKYIIPFVSAAVKFLISLPRCD